MKPPPTTDLRLNVRYGSHPCGPHLSQVPLTPDPSVRTAPLGTPPRCHRGPSPSGVKSPGPSDGCSRYQSGRQLVLQGRRAVFPLPVTGSGASTTTAKNQVAVSGGRRRHRVAFSMALVSAVALVSRSTAVAAGRRPPAGPGHGR